MPRASSSASTTDARMPHTRRRPLRAGLLAIGGGALALLLLPAVHHSRLRLIWNASASVPLGLYRVQPGVTPRIGDLVALRPSPALGRFMAERHYVEANVLLIKPVVASSGATVCREQTRVTVDAQTVAAALSRDRIGRPLPTWSGCRRLRAHQLFLIAPMRPDSFDSRYFGPVDRSDVVGRAIPLWTWS